MLNSGSPDDATKITSADLLLDVIRWMPNASLITFKRLNAVMSKTDVQSGLSKSFEEVLNVQCASCDCMSELIAVEVRESLISALFANLGPSETLACHGITPDTQT